MCCCFFVFDSSPLTASVSGSPLGLKRMREESARSNMVPAEGFGRRCVGVVLWAWAWVCECVCPGDNTDDGDDILIIYSFLFEFFFDNHQVDDTQFSFGSGSSSVFSHFVASVIREKLM